jgi:hypothetical protein
LLANLQRDNYSILNSILCSLLQDPTLDAESHMTVLTIVTWMLRRRVSTDSFYPSFLPEQ